MEILLAAVGIAIGWFANHFYSRRGALEVRRLFDDQADLIAKLPDAIVAAVRNEPKRHITLEELSALSRATQDRDVLITPRKLSPQAISELPQRLARMEKEPLAIFSA